MEFTRLTKKYVTVDVTASLWNGDPAEVTGFVATVTARAGSPVKASLWTAALFDAGPPMTARVLVAGPDADPAGAWVLGDNGGRLWLGNEDNPELDYFSACVIRVI